MVERFFIRAPGRVCLFGDHQDYLQLPVIACAIDRYLSLSATANNHSCLLVDQPDLQRLDRIALNEPLEAVKNGDYLRLGMRVMKRHGCIPDRGFNITIQGNIPINAGLSSSSALTIAWLHFLWDAFGQEQPLSDQKLVQLAYETEVVEQGSGGGKMDHYTIQTGGLIYLDTAGEKVETLQAPLPEMVIGVSGLPKDTVGLLSQLKTATWRSIKAVKTAFPEFELETAQPGKLKSWEHTLPEMDRPVFQAAIRNHAITRAAKEAFLQPVVDQAVIGELMNRHQAILRDNLGITKPRIDNMIDSALKAGALGAKIVGSGGGGCIVALVNKESKEQVMDAIRAAGAVEAFAVATAPGPVKNRTRHD